MSEQVTNTATRWESDKLQRKETADFLTSYLVNRYATRSNLEKSDTLTLNVRAEWGHGKTYLLTRWAEDLKDTGFPVVFYDAWKNDFSEDPLVGFIAEINKSLSVYFSKIPVAKRDLDYALVMGRKLIKPVGLAVASAITQKIAGSTIEELSELFELADEEESKGEGENSKESKLNKEVSKLAEIALKEHLSKQETIRIFTKRLERLIESLKAESTIQLPIFIFIDELDRCRPNYAIELLEAIKHLFGVAGIYFVLSTNIDQLGHSIKAVYGENFDSERYLKRFFDQEYLLPSPNAKQFISYLFENYTLDKFGKYYSVIESDLYSEETPEQVVFRLFSENFGLSLRDQEQVALSLNAILLSWPKDERIHFSYLTFLVVIKQISTSTFRKIADNSYKNRHELSDELQKISTTNVKFKTKNRTRDPFSGAQIQEESLVDMASHYFECSLKTSAELHQREANRFNYPEKIVNAVSDDSPRTWNAGDGPLTCISTYAKRVSSVGQLTISKT